MLSIRGQNVGNNCVCNLTEHKTCVRLSKHQTSNKKDAMVLSANLLPHLCTSHSSQTKTTVLLLLETVLCSLLLTQIVFRILSTEGGKIEFEINSRVPADFKEQTAPYSGRD